MRYVVLTTLLALLAHQHSVNSAGASVVEHKNVERTIDLASQLVKINYKITLSPASQDVSSYEFQVPAPLANKLAFISARDALKKKLKVSEAKKLDTGASSYTLQLSGGSSSVLYIETVFTKAQIPHPTHITQQEKQLVRFFGQLYFYTPYKTLSQKTTVLLSSRNVESYTQVKPVSHVDTTITYGPYENIAPLTDEELMVHYENQTPFLVVSKMERTIEISHWGNIAVEETIDLVHSGAILKGSFSRYDFQRDTRSGAASVKSYKTVLPASATGVYYRDTNGNISTSAMRVLKDSVELDLRPRFPLFGGWKTHYTIGYDVPSFEYLFSSGNNFLLKMRLVDHVYDDMIVDDLTVKIILPEGTNNIKLIPPFSVGRLADSLHYTYLDTFGRPVITFTKQNLVENHITDFNLSYNFSRIMMLQEPLLVVGFFMLMFLLVIVWLRLDFSISKEPLQHHHKD